MKHRSSGCSRAAGLLHLARGPVAVGAILLAACAGRQHTPSQAAPSFLLGNFADDYGGRYAITAREWMHLPGARYHIIRWDVGGQYLIGQNDIGNPSDGGLWTRIDWVQLPGMAPYIWGYCYSAYRAPSAAAAESVTVARRATPRTGCNGYPFSRMRPVD